MIPISFCALVPIVSSCGDFLKETSQDAEYVRSWSDLDELLIGDCYMPINGTHEFNMASSSCNYGSFLHLVSDELDEVNVPVGSYMVYDAHEASYGYYTWQQRSGQNESYSGYSKENKEWTEVYKLINVANNVLNSANNVPQNLDSEKQGVLKVMGEAHFLRAFYYFWLVNVYGKPYDPATAATDPGVPLKLNSEVYDVKYDRSSVQAIYNQVLSDLHDAENELTLYQTPKKSIYRADSTAVNMLLSRVYLYMQNWEKATEYAKKVIADHPRLEQLNSSTADNVFMSSDNAENIFSMGGDDTPLIVSIGTKGYSVSKDLYNTYSDNDYRKSQWYWKYSGYIGTIKRAKVDVFNTKYIKTNPEYYYNYYNYGMSGSQSPVSSLFWLRSAEAYLNLAEAEAYQGHESTSKEALLTLMKARYDSKDPNLDISSLTGSNLIAKIRKERRLELALEGHRWFDLRRWRVCSVQPEKISITHTYTYYSERNSATITSIRSYELTKEDSTWTLPIPNEVLQFNTGMAGNNNPVRKGTEIFKND